MGKEMETGGFDMFKLVLAVCLLAVIALGVLAYMEMGRLEVAKRKYRQAERAMPQIRAIHDSILALKSKERLTQTRMDLRDYVESQLATSGISQDMYELILERKHQDTKIGVEDETVKINFKAGPSSREKVAFPRENIFSLLYNLEAKNPQTKVTRISMEAEETSKGRRRKEDPKLLSDRWVVRDLMVVKRSPGRVKDMAKKGK